MPIITPTVKGPTQPVVTAQTAYRLADSPQPANPPPGLAPATAAAETPAAPAAAAPAPAEARPGVDRIALIARKERELARKQQALRPFQEAAELAKTDRLAAIQKLGFSIQDLNQDYLNLESPTPERIAEATAARAVETRLTEFEQRQEESRQNQLKQDRDQALQTIREQVVQLAKAPNSTLDLVEAHEAYDQVVSYIVDVWEREGRFLQPEEAAAAVNKAIEEEILATVQKSERLRNLILPPKEEVKPASNPPQQRVPQPALTNRTAAAPSSPSASRKPTREEIERRSQALFWGGTLE